MGVAVRGRYVKTAGLVIVLVGMLVAVADAADPQTLKEASWVCHTPEAYDQVMKEANGRQGRDLEALKRQLRDEKRCIYLDDNDLEDMMSPYVKVLSREDDKVKVSFAIEFYKRIEYLHRKITRVRYAGWTDAQNLRNYEP